MKNKKREPKKRSAARADRPGEKRRGEKSKARLWLEMFLVFFKIGAFTFGGGYAMIAVVEREIAERRGYVTKKDILDIVAVAESTPGPIAINMATFVGYRTAGFFGSLAATLGVVLPSFCVIFVLSFVIRRFRAIREVGWAFCGIRAGVLALICKGWLSMAKACPKSVFSLVIAVASFAVATLTDISVLWVIGGAALLGLVYFSVCERVGKEAGK